MLIFSMFLVPLVVIVLMGFVFMIVAAGNISENPEILDDSAAITTNCPISSQDPEGLLDSPIMM